MSGIRWTSISSFVIAMLQVFQLVILSRLLDVKAFGLLAILNVIVGFSQSFLDMGLGNATIYKQEITNIQLSTLYWLNVITGVILFLIIACLSPLIALFYHENSLTLLIILISTTFIIQAFGQQYHVLLQKELEFSSISIIDMVSKSMGFLTTISLAYLQYGVYSLVYGVILASILQTCCLSYIGLKKYGIFFKFNWGSIEEFLSFGFYQMGERLVNYFNSQIDVVLIGKLMGVETLGFYNIAKQLIMKPIQIVNPIITKVSFPIMASVQNDCDRLKKIYLTSLNVLCTINFFVYALMVILAEPLINIIFGSQWSGAVSFVQILAIYGAFRSVANPVGSLLLAKGRAKLGFYWNVWLLLVFPPAILLSGMLDVYAILWTMTLLMIMMVIPMWYWLVRPLCGAGFIEYHKNIALPLFSTIWMGVLYCFFEEYLLINNDVFHVVSVLFFGITIYVVLNIFFNHVISNEIRDMLSRGKYK